MAEQIGEASHNGQAQAQPLAPCPLGVLQLDEFLKDKIMRGRRNADAVVAHFHTPCAVTPTADDEHPASGGIAHGVAEQIGQYAFEQHAVAAHAYIGGAA